MKKQIILYGLIGGVLIALLKLIEFCFLVIRTYQPLSGFGALTGVGWDNLGYTLYFAATHSFPLLLIFGH